MPDHDIPPPNTFTPNEPMKDVFRSRTELVEVLNRYRENLRWYVEERNRLVEEVRAFRAEQSARISGNSGRDVRLEYWLRDYANFRPEKWKDIREFLGLDD